MQSAMNHITSSPSPAVRLGRIPYCCIIHSISFLWCRSCHLKDGQSWAYLPLYTIHTDICSHWLVFWASMASALTAFGIVPLQAGIFSIEKISHHSSQTFALSEKFIPADQQLSKLNIQYANAAYSILVLNETLPAYMAINYTLAPFAPRSFGAIKQGTFKVDTKMYSLDLHCNRTWTNTNASRKGSMSIRHEHISPDCSIPLYDFANETIGSFRDENGVQPLRKALVTYREYSSIFLGKFESKGIHDSPGTGFGSGWCKNLAAANHTFIAAFGRNKIRDSDPANNVTGIACKPWYYEQQGTATIDAVSREPITFAPSGEKVPLAAELFNVTEFEYAAYAAAQVSDTKEDYLPSMYLPTYYDQFIDSNLSFPEYTFGYINPMTTMSLVMDGADLEDYLDADQLSDSYQDAFRLLFSRYMNQVLATDFKSDTVEAPGQVNNVTEAVVLEPVFTYIVEALLAVVSIAALVLLYMGFTNKSHLYSDPGTYNILQVTSRD
jgi:hypothetical protein